MNDALTALKDAGWEVVITSQDAITFLFEAFPPTTDPRHGTGRYAMLCTAAAAHLPPSPDSFFVDRLRHQRIEEMAFVCCRDEKIECKSPVLAWFPQTLGLNKDTPHE